MNGNKSTERAHDAAMAKGTQDHLSSVGSLTITGKPYTVPQIVQRYDARIARLDGVTAARAALEAAIAEERADRSGFKQFDLDLRSIVIGMFSNDPETLADFSLSPRKKAPKKKVSAKLQTVNKALATRKARHTMGKLQKKDVKGTVPAPQPAPSPAAPSPVQGTPAPGSGNGAAPQESPTHP